MGSRTTAHYFHNLRHGNWWGVLDTLAHTLRLPRRIQNPICDRYDRSLGAFNEPVTTSSSATIDVKWKRGG